MMKIEWAFSVFVYDASATLRLQFSAQGFCFVSAISTDHDTYQQFAPTA